ncbi:MAG: hypothetical protein ACRELC_14030 [Gemmatimonadota bacterium]
MIARRMETEERPLTLDEFERLPEGLDRLELVRGRLVRVGP